MQSETFLFVVKLCSSEIPSESVSYLGFRVFFLGKFSLSSLAGWRQETERRDRRRARFKLRHSRASQKSLKRILCAYNPGMGPSFPSVWTRRKCPKSSARWSTTSRRTEPAPCNGKWKCWHVNVVGQCLIAWLIWLGWWKIKSII